ncbi:GNAT family N-acetyltransferase [Streptomyces sp. NBC_01537]|uniref:GNAT family N-acetyltransferase n=1 Tax=Streptomyces sp. NBC_01537 TaxID=2903896 RepID=UPI003865A268
MEVEAVREITGEIAEAFARLVPQLSSSGRAPGAAELAEIVAVPSTVLLVARVDGAIAGTATLVTYRTPTGVRGRIEDVVVDAGARGRGVGEALTEGALAEAGQRGVRSVDLTSRPSREAANRLYRRMGLVARDSVVYRHTTSTGHNT